MTSNALRVATLFGVLALLSHAAPEADAQKPVMDADATWTYRYDTKVDGKVADDATKAELVLAVRNDKIAGHFAGESGKGKDRWSGEAAGKDSRILMLRQDREGGYVAFFVGRLVKAGQIQGTWCDTSGHSGDFELVKKAK
jgi:hypothetical protein